ncbi:MAG: MFS transporter [Deltaproteobacteria bacterium]|jgi:MFS family permease|nr:MFS transporter [Deltaproteobacteria bacterium]
MSQETDTDPSQELKENAVQAAEETYPPQHESSLWSRTFVTMLFINFLNFLGFYMLLPTLSLYLTMEGCPAKEIGLVIGSFTLSSIACRLLSIVLAKRFGGVKVVRAGLLVIATGTLFFFMFHHTLSYVTARLLQGAGFGVTSTLIISMASEIIPPSHLAEGLGYMGLGNTLAMALGPLLGMFISHIWGFTVMFLSMSAASLIASSVTLLLPNIKLFYLPKHITKKPESFHLDKRPFPAASLGMLYGVAISAVTAYMAIYAQEAKLPSAASFFLVSTAGTLVARLTTGKIYDHKGDRAILPAAIFILFCGYLLILHAKTGEHLAYYLGAVVYGYGIGAVFPAIQTLTISSVPHSKRSLGVSTFFVLYDLGTGVGTVLLGLLAGHFHGYRVVFDASTFCIIFIFLGYGFFYLVPSHRKIRLALSKEE